MIWEERGGVDAKVFVGKVGEDARCTPRNIAKKNGVNMLSISSNFLMSDLEKWAP